MHSAQALEREKGDATLYEPQDESGTVRSLFPGKA